MKQRPSAQLLEIHRSITLKHASMMKEIPEQEMAVRFLTGEERVLEIGGNVGRNSLVISALQAGKSGSLTVVESDPGIAARLIENRDANGADFRVVTGAISKGTMFQKHWRCVKADVSPGPDYIEVPVVDYDDVSGGVDFDALVLDCEGAIGQIIDDYPSILNGVTKVIIENDFIDDTEKRRVHDLFRKHGLHVAMQKGLKWNDRGGEWIPDFYQVWLAR